MIHSTFSKTNSQREAEFQTLDMIPFPLLLVKVSESNRHHILQFIFPLLRQNCKAFFSENVLARLQHSCILGWSSHISVEQSPGCSRLQLNLESDFDNIKWRSDRT